MSRKSIALIGGSGFIGTNIAQRLLHDNYNILIISRNPDRNISSVNKQIIRKSVDVNWTSKLINVLDGYENIVWLVNELLPSVSMDSLVQDFSFNISPLISFLESTRKLSKLRRFIFFSSGGTVYGNTLTNNFIDEESPTRPISAYGLSKLISEKYIDFITRKSSFQSIILRPSNVYGEHQNINKPQGIVAHSLYAIINKKSLDVYDGGNMIRDFIHVSDLSSVIKKLIERSYQSSKVDIYNVGSEYGVKINQILEIISEISGEKIKTIYRPSRPFDCDFNVLSINKIKSELGWIPNTSIRDGLEKTWIWANSGKAFKK